MARNISIAFKYQGFKRVDVRQRISDFRSKLDENLRSEEYGRLITNELKLNPVIIRIIVPNKRSSVLNTIYWVMERQKLEAGVHLEFK